MWAPGYEHLAAALPTAKSITLAETEGEGIVFHYPELNVVVKRRYPNCGVKYQVKWEYDVGMLINAYNNPHMIKTLGFFIEGSDACIVTEYVPGVTLAKLSHKRHTQELYLRIFSCIHDAQEQMEFTHYDLHQNNIIVEDNGNICFIDFARTHVRGVQPGWFETQIIDGGTCPGIFDPMFDYATLTTGIQRRISSSFDKALSTLFERNYFETNRNEGFVGYPMSDCYRGSLNDRNIAWACDRGLALGFACDYDGNDYETLAAICVGEKRRQMRDRHDTPEEFFNACLDFITRKLS